MFYGGNGQLLLCQFIEILFIVGWVAACTGVLFGALKFFGRLRVRLLVGRARLGVGPA